MYDRNYSANGYPVVGRDGRIALDKYLVRVNRRNIIDYEKLKHEEPELYQEILHNEIMNKSLIVEKMMKARLHEIVIPPLLKHLD